MKFEKPSESETDSQAMASYRLGGRMLLQEIWERNLEDNRSMSEGKRKKAEKEEKKSTRVSSVAEKANLNSTVLDEEEREKAEKERDRRWEEWKPRGHG